MSELSEQYKAKANHFEKRAAEASAPGERERLMTIAAGYHALARLEESRTNKPSQG